MTAIVVCSPDTARADMTVAPTHPTGRPYRYVMTYRTGGRRAYADTATELVAALIPGYADLRSDQGRREARIRFARDARIGLQATLMVGRISLCSDAELRVLLAFREDAPPAPRVWSAAVPLVLVTSFYVPTGSFARPAVHPPAEILWLDPEDDLALLTSLHLTGVLQFTATPLAGAADDLETGPTAAQHAEETGP